MPKEGWISISLPDTLIEKIDRELEKDRDFKSKPSFIIYVMRAYLEKDDREKIIKKAGWNSKTIEELLQINEDLSNLKEVHKEAHKEEKIRARAREYYETHKEEMREREREYYEAHKEKMRERARKYYEAHKEKIKARERKYYETHKEKMRERAREYYEAHKEEIRARAREYYETHKEEIKAKRKK